MRERAISISPASGLTDGDGAGGFGFVLFGCDAAHQELFCKGRDIINAQWLPSPVDWLPLGGQFSSIVAFGVAGDLLGPPIDLYGVGLNNEMFYGEMDFPLEPSPAWPPVPFGWSPLGRFFKGSPAVLAYGSLFDAADNNEGNFYEINLIVIGVGTDNQAYASAFLSGDPKTQTDWVPLGGAFISELLFDTSSFGPPPNTLTKFAVLGVQTDAQLYRLEVDATNWPPALSQWTPLGGCFKSSLDAVSWGPGRLDVFGLDNHLEMYHRAFQGGVPLENWEPLGGLFDSPPAVVSWGQNRLDIFGVQTDGGMYHKAWDGNQWLPSPLDWEYLGKPPNGVFVSAPAATLAASSVAAPVVNRIDLFALGEPEPEIPGRVAEPEMYHKAWDGNQWLPSPVDWEALGGGFHVPRSTTLPDRLDFSGQIVFPEGFAIVGSVHLTLFSNGTYNFSGQLHDSGAAGYHASVVCALYDTNNRVYVFPTAGDVAGTFAPGSRDYFWGGLAGPNAEIAANWNDFFGCGGSKISVYGNTNLSVVALIADLVFPPGLTIIDVASK